MRFHALACDYDGTLVSDGELQEGVIEALERFRATGRRLLLVTGRNLEDLLEICPRLDIFDSVVCENGALTYHPKTAGIRVLAAPPPASFLREMERQHISPLSTGRVVVATWRPNEGKVLAIIRELGLDLQITFNKGAVMVLPPMVNKLSGLRVALNELGLSPRNTVGVGDAENDHAFLDFCEVSVAVGNALESLKLHADFVTHNNDGAGVVELVEKILEDDLSSLLTGSKRQKISFAVTSDNEEIELDAATSRILITGSSRSGKSTTSLALLDSIASRGYQFCVVDPEGDYSCLYEAVEVGNSRNSPEHSSVLRILENPQESCVVNLLGLSLDCRSDFLRHLMSGLINLREKVGRPHWIVIDEAHHMLHPYWKTTIDDFPYSLTGLVLITVHPKEVDKKILASVNTLICTGEDGPDLIRQFCDLLDIEAPQTFGQPLHQGEALVWKPGASEARVFKIRLRSRELRRHLRKYASGDVGKRSSFFFTGPKKVLNIRARNLYSFMDIADGVDDETWLFHLNRGDYSNWFEHVVRDAELAKETRAIEKMHLSADESRKRTKKLIRERYTAPSRLDD